MQVPALRTSIFGPAAPRGHEERPKRV